MIWLRLVEVWLTTRLLSSPVFHRGVRRVHKKIQEVSRGEKLHDLSELNGTNLDKPARLEAQKFLAYFKEEIREQFRGTTKK